MDLDEQIQQMLEYHCCSSMQWDGILFGKGIYQKPKKHGTLIKQSLDCNIYKCSSMLMMLRTHLPGAFVRGAAGF